MFKAGGSYVFYATHQNPKACHLYSSLIAAQTCFSFMPTYN